MQTRISIIHDNYGYHNLITDIQNSIMDIDNCIIGNHKRILNILYCSMHDLCLTVIS